MRQWVFNENVSNHRGVWHVSKNELVAETVEETRREYESNVYGKHKKPCPFAGEEVYYAGSYVNGEKDQSKYYIKVPDPNRSWNYTQKFVNCTCGIGNDGVIGTYTKVTIYPEHIEYRGTEALCNQVKIGRSGGVGWGSYGTKAGVKVGDVVTETVRVKQPFIFEGDVPPGPYCSRCLAKAEKNESSNEA